MIKLVGSGKNGRRIILLGLEEMNVLRMREGRPMHIHGEELGMANDNFEIVIILGKDVEALTKEVSSLIGPETAVRDYREEKKQ